MTLISRRRLLGALIALPFAFAAESMPAQAKPDCSAAVQRVLARTGGEYVSVSVVKGGGQDICRVTVLASDSSGSRRRKLTVDERP